MAQQNLGMSPLSGARTRRSFLRLALVSAPAAAALAACGSAAVSNPGGASSPPAGGPAASATRPAAPAASPSAPAAADAGSATAAPPARSAGSPAAATPQASSAQGPTAAQAGGTLAPTPACASNASVTAADDEGPYFKPNSPERSSLLESGVSGTTLTVSGYVLTPDCKPVARALLDFWQADASGQYDNSGFRLRGHQYTDANGAFTLQTVVPGLYPGRTRHIHVKPRRPMARC